MTPAITDRPIYRVFKIAAVVRVLRFRNLSLSSAFCRNLHHLRSGVLRCADEGPFRRDRGASREDDGGICAHKLAALLCYFHAGLALEGTADDARIVRFERVACPPAADFEQMLSAASESSDAPSWAETIELHAGGMEDRKGDG